MNIIKQNKRPAGLNSIWQQTIISHDKINCINIKAFLETIYRQSVIFGLNVVACFNNSIMIEIEHDIT